MKIRVNDNKQIVMNATTKEKSCYVIGENKYDIVYNVRIEEIRNMDGVEIVGCRIFNDSIFIDSGLECKKKIKKQLDKITEELTTENFINGLIYLKNHILDMSLRRGLDNEDKENIKIIDDLLENNNLENMIEY